MKLLALIAALSSMSALANKDTSQFKGLAITPVESIKIAQQAIIVNDLTYKTDGHSAVTPGLVVYDKEGFNAYTVSGEIIVKLNKQVDFEQFNRDNDLMIKQAYKSFYILKSQSDRDLLPLVSKLEKLDGVSSVTLELVDKGIIEK